MRGAAKSYAESFHASVWARMGGPAAQAYVRHWVVDPREFLIVADHRDEGIVGGLMGTVRRDEHRKGVLAGNLGRLSFALGRTITARPAVGVELGRRLAAGLHETLRGWSRGTAAPVVEHVASDWPLEVDQPGFIAQYFVSPRARGQKLATQMCALAVQWCRVRRLRWAELHTYADNVASQTTASASGFRLVHRQGPRMTYRRYLGEPAPSPSPPPR